MVSASRNCRAYGRKNASSKGYSGRKRFPSSLNPVLGVRQLVLQGQKVLAGFQLRVVLGHREEAANTGDERVLRAGQIGRRSRLCDRRRARFRDLFEELSFVRRISLHRVHEVRDQVVAAAELGLDIGPRVANEIALSDEAVVRNCESDEEETHDAGSDVDRDHVPSLNVSSTTRGMCLWKPCAAAITVAIAGGFTRLQ